MFFGIDEIDQNSRLGSLHPSPVFVAFAAYMTAA